MTFTLFDVSLLLKLGTSFVSHPMCLRRNNSEMFELNALTDQGALLRGYEGRAWRHVTWWHTSWSWRLTSTRVSVAVESMTRDVHQIAPSRAAVNMSHATRGLYKPHSMLLNYLLNIYSI